MGERFIKNKRPAMGPAMGPKKTKQVKSLKPGKSKIQRVQDMNKALPKNANGKYILMKSTTNPSGKIIFKGDKKSKLMRRKLK
tara:strand:- start:230 stop:478 length:249 start_codon:yes stop_codon:yes gene_type:complete